MALVYGLATMVVQVAHDHGARRAGPEAVALPGCDDPRPHYSGHGAPELIRGDLHCPACQFRAEHQAVASRPATAPAVASRLGAAPSALGLLPSAIARPTCRGPPLA